MNLRYRKVVVLGLALALIFSANLAFAETRKLALFNVNTKETLEVSSRTNGQYSPDAIKKLNWFFRDWRRNEPTKMDTRLFDLLADIHEKSGSGSPIHVLSGYRSPATNSMLRRKSSAVARESQHMEGKAVDFFIPGVPIAKLRNIALKEQEGGVGFYPRSHSPFVHVDVASIRAWPRPSRELLVSLFPDGNTAYVPSDGRPLSASAAAKSRSVFKTNGIFAVIGNPSERPNANNLEVAGVIPLSPPIPRARPIMDASEYAPTQALAYGPVAPTSGGGDPFEAILKTREKLFRELEEGDAKRQSVRSDVKSTIQDAFRYVAVRKSARPVGISSD